MQSCAGCTPGARGYEVTTTVEKSRLVTGLTVVFYAGLTALLLSVITKALPHVLPHPVATRIAHNSEGYAGALILAAWIQYVRPRLRGTARQWPVTLAVAAALFAIGLFLALTSLPGTVKTLNEAFFATAVVIPYVQLNRPLPRRLAAGLSLAVLIVIVVGHRTKVITKVAETFAIVLLVPVGLDLVDRGILDARARTSTAARWGWYALLALAPIVFSVLQYRIHDHGALEVATRFAVRTTEAFVLMLLVELYFTVGLDRTGGGSR